MSHIQNLHSAMKYLLSLSLTLLCLQPMFGQIKFGPRVAISSSGISSTDLILRNGQDVEELSLKLQESTPQYQFGVFTRLSLGPVFLQPELLLSTSKVTYLYQDLDAPVLDPSGTPTEDGVATLLSERDFDLEIPAMVGLKMGFLRIQGGPVYRMNLGTKSDLRNIEGIGRTFKEASMGMQAGFGLDLGEKVVIDVKYQLDLRRTQDEITFLGNTHRVSQHGGRLVAGLGVAF